MVKTAVKIVETIFVAKPSDKLQILVDYSQSSKATGGRLMISRLNDSEEPSQLLGGHFSCKLNLHKINWLPYEVEALGVSLVAKHFGPIIMENENTTTIYTDN